MINRSNLEKSHIERLRKIKMVVLDVDGVLTDATVHMNSIGEWCRNYNIRDGWAIVRLKECGYLFAVITGAQSRDVRERLKYLKVDYLFEGQKEKTGAFEDLLTQSNLKAEEVAYMGDDVPDVPLIARAGFGASVPDGLPEAKNAACWVSQRHGGHGAVRELCDLIWEYGALSEKEL